MRRVVAVTTMPGARRATTILAGAAVLALGCHATDRPNRQPVPTTSGASEARGREAAHARAETTQALDDIASARCDRESACRHIGDGMTYPDRPACLARIRADWAGDLSTYDCPGGVRDQELAQCLEEIRNEDCASPFDSLERMVECRSRDLCIAT